MSAHISGRILVMHGGLGNHVKTIDEINSVPRPIVDPFNHTVDGVDYSKILVDVMWSDPRDSDKKLGTHASPRGKVIRNCSSL